MNHWTKKLLFSRTSFSYLITEWTKSSEVAPLNTVGLAVTKDLWWEESRICWEFRIEQEADWTGSFFYLGHWRFLRRGTTRIRSSSIQPLPFYLTEEGGSPINETLIHQWRGLETSISLATRRDARDPLTNELRRGGNQWMHPSTLAIRDLCYGPTGWFDWRGTLGSG